MCNWLGSVCLDENSLDQWPCHDCHCLCWSTQQILVKLGESCWVVALSNKDVVVFIWRSDTWSSGVSHQLMTLWPANRQVIIEYIVHGFKNGLLYEFNLLWSINLSISTMFRPISYGPCSRTGVMCVGSDLGRIIWLYTYKAEQLTIKCEIQRPVGYSPDVEASTLLYHTNWTKSYFENNHTHNNCNHSLSWCKINNLQAHVNTICSGLNAV